MWLYMKRVDSVKIEIAIDGELNVLEFKPSDCNKYITKEGVILEAIFEGTYCYDANRIDNCEIFNEYTEQIIELFIENYSDSINKLVEDLESGVESTQENQYSDLNILVPYDPNSIRVTQGRFSLKEIYEMIMGDEYEEPILDLSPDFQRNYVWDNTRKSRLIESILLKIPLPVFYLARDKEGKYQVVDGVQRLSVIKEFFSNGFKLRNLEYLNEECDNKFFQNKPNNSLHPKFVRHLRFYQIDCNIIEPDTPHKVKLDIFKRLNTGGRSLNNQEIRNSILKNVPRDFIRALSKSDEFKKATNNSITPKRMMDQEIILRFLGFYFIYNKPKLFPSLVYNGVMDEFLDGIVELLNSEFRKIPFESIKKDFLTAMENAYIMFGDYAFRKVNPSFESESRNMINKSLFTAFSTLVPKYDNLIVKKRGLIIQEFAQTLKKDTYLYESITYGTNDKVRIDTTILRISVFLDSIYGG